MPSIERQYQNEIDDLKAEITGLRNTLQEISLGRGRFSLDHFTHANNTIEDMKQLSIDALNGKYYTE